MNPFCTRTEMKSAAFLQAIKTSFLRRGERVDEDKGGMNSVSLHKHSLNDVEEKIIKYLTQQRKFPCTSLRTKNSCFFHSFCEGLTFSFFQTLVYIALCAVIIQFLKYVRFLCFFSKKKQFCVTEENGKDKNN